MGRRVAAIILSAIAAGLLFMSLRLPLWQMHMEAPQYQDEEALNVFVFAKEMRGDMDELKVLNSYIGVRVPETLPQNRWLPGLLMGAAIAGVLGSLLPPRKLRKRTLFIIPTLVALGLVVAAAQAQMQMREIGTNRDEKTTLVGVKDFTTPLIGRTKIAQFTITSFLSWGSLAIAGGLTCLWIAGWLSRTPNDKNRDRPQAEPPGAVGNLNPNPRSA
jgi:hypothetical protein